MFYILYGDGLPLFVSILIYTRRWIKNFVMDYCIMK